jgi:hypothetical protein
VSDIERQILDAVGRNTAALQRRAGASRAGATGEQSMKKSKPDADADISTLQRALDLRNRFDAGIFPTGIGQRSHFGKLVRRGLLEFDAWGRDIDGLVERDVEIYKLTPAGKAAALDAMERATPGASA